ncbi:NtaA/DmoA family FMN-dependent monooxygenase [Streptosporangium amethystogenes]|uniref:NtaA/DmoA family FMN-dependent monooxygenase n=1 Tax=Streptosporangium amethystogenes TaxID=2002 RepID=UPI003623EFAF
MARKRLIFNAFVCPSPGHVKPGLWPHDLPGNELIDFDQLDTWIRLAKKLEEGRFDGLFIGDVLGLYAPYGGNWDVFVRDGNRFPMLDSLILASTLVPETQNLGLILTASVIQDHPYSLARRIATLDHFSKGRVGWNIVTSSTENAHKNYGADTIINHDERYEWAEEHVDAVLKLLEGSWEEGAVVRDTARKIYADPGKVHRINHEGRHYKVEGPLIVHPSPQRVPTLFQAGSSPRGIDFATRFAEGALLLNSLEGAGNVISGLRQGAAKHGRRPEDIKILAALTFVVGSTEREAKEKWEQYEDLMNHEALAAEVGGNIGIDLSKLDMDDPIDYSNAQGGIGKIIAEAKKYRNGVITKRQYLQGVARETTIVGTPEQVADRLEQWQDAGIDGVNVMNYLIPGTYHDFVDQVIPELQSRGLAQTEYSPGTLREKLFVEGPHLNRRHPGYAYRGAFTAPL